MLLLKKKCNEIYRFRVLPSDVEMLLRRGGKIMQLLIDCFVGKFFEYLLKSVHVCQ